MASLKSTAKRTLIPESPAWREEEILRCIRGYKKNTGLEYWLKTYVFTFDEPKRLEARYPCWPFQLQYMRELERGGKILVEKPRDMMITWSTAIYCLYCLLFKPGWTGFCISRRENEVDDGGEKSTVRSIFGRIRFSWEHLPEWMRGDFSFTLLKIINNEPGMNTFMTGEATKITSGQSISCSFKWADELSQVEQSEKVHASMTGANFETLVYTSISNLMGNAFARLRHDKDSGFRVLTFPWYMRPDRDDEWYKAKAADLTPIERAKQLDIVYELNSPASVFKRFNWKTHVRPPEECPTDAQRWVIGFDNGFAKPAAMYLAAIRSGRLIVLLERYTPGIHVKLPPGRRVADEKDWVDIACELERVYAPWLRRDKHIVECVCVGWSSGASSKAEVSETAAHFEMDGFKTFTVQKAKGPRIKLVDQWMGLDSQGVPYLTISSACEKLLWEIPKQAYEVHGEAVSEVVADGNDHGCEALSAICEYLDAPVKAPPKWISDVDSWGKPNG